jgi:hypothetical protein
MILLVLSCGFISRAQDSLFPKISGWTITQEDQVYDSNNLWDIIDGAADLYLEYAFDNLQIARYTSADSIEVKVELYRHQTETDAFGIYSQERDPGYNFIPLGVQGYLQQGVLNFLDGVYYIKLSTYQTGVIAQNALRIIGNRLDEHLNQKNAFPAVLKMFPMTGKLANSEQYVARNFLGYSFLNNAYLASYNDDGAFKVFIIETESPEKARIMVSEYLKVLPKESVTMIEKNRYNIRDAHSGEIVIIVQKAYLYGAINYTHTQKRDFLLKEITGAIAK